MSTTAIERIGLVNLESVEKAKEFAVQIIKSGLVPQSYRTPEAVLVAFQHGQELGLKPMQSLRIITVVNGTPAIHGKWIHTIPLSKGLVEEFEEYFDGSGDDMAAVCKVTRKGFASGRVTRFSVKDAKNAGLWGKNTWATYPKDMMRYKARARAFNDLFSDVLCGMPTAEDLDEDQGLKPVGAEVKEPPKGSDADPLLEQVAGKIQPEPTVEQQEQQPEQPGPEQGARDFQLEADRESGAVIGEVESITGQTLKGGAKRYSIRLKGAAAPHFTDDNGVMEFARKAGADKKPVKIYAQATKAGAWIEQIVLAEQEAAVTA